MKRTSRDAATSLLLSFLLACSASHAPDSEDPDAGASPAIETSCEGGLFLGRRQLYSRPRWGVGSGGQVWFSDGASIRIASAELTAPLLLSEDPYEPVISPEGDRLSFRVDGEYGLYEVETGEQLRVPAPFVHEHGFVATLAGRSRAWSCAAGTLTLIDDESVTRVARDVADCQRLVVSEQGPALGWLDELGRFRWLYGDSLEPRMFEPELEGSLRLGRVEFSSDGRFLLHQPKRYCDPDDRACRRDANAGFVQLHDARDGRWRMNVSLDPSYGGRMHRVEGPGVLSLDRGEMTTLIGEDGRAHEFEEFQTLTGFAEAILARSHAEGLWLLTIDGTATPLSPPGVDSDVRVASSPDGRRFAIAHRTGRCLRMERGSCQEREWRLLLGDVDEPAAAVERLGWGSPRIAAVSDRGLVLLTGLMELGEPEGDSGRFRILDASSRTLVAGVGRVGQVELDGSRFYFTLDGSLWRFEPGVGLSDMGAEAERFILDLPRSRLLRLRAFPEEEDLSDYGPQTDFCVFQTPLDGPRSR